MDSGALVTLSIVLGVAFLICSQAKGKNGDKYGIKKMSKIWVIAVGLMGAQAIYKITIETDGSESELPIVAILLVLMPVFMIGSNVINKFKKSRAEPDGSGQPM